MSAAAASAWSSAARAVSSRPSTAPTGVPEDGVGSVVPRGRQRVLDRAAASGRIVTDPDGGEAVPLHVGDRVVGVIERHAATRRSGRLEEVYHDLAERLLVMASEGRFPPPQAQQT